MPLFRDDSFDAKFVRLPTLKCRKEREGEWERERDKEWKGEKEREKKRTRNDCLNNKRPTQVAKKSLAAAFCPTFNKFLLDSNSQRRKSKQQFCDLSRNLGWVLQTVFFTRDHRRTFKISYLCSALLGKARCVLEAESIRKNKSAFLAVTISGHC